MLIELKTARCELFALLAQKPKVALPPAEMSLL
jgi:hypothetical protein